MAHHNHACKADPSSLGFGEGISLSTDHLSPKRQRALTEVKKKTKLLSLFADRWQLPSTGDTRRC